MRRTSGLGRSVNLHETAFEVPIGFGAGEWVRNSNRLGSVENFGAATIFAPPESSCPDRFRFSSYAMQVTMPPAAYGRRDAHRRAGALGVCRLGAPHRRQQLLDGEPLVRVSQQPYQVVDADGVAEPHGGAVVGDRP